MNISGTIINLTHNAHRRPPVILFDKHLALFTELARDLYVLLVILGVLLNAYILSRLIAFASANKQRFGNGAGLPLMAMCSADLLTLLGIIVEVIITAFLTYDALPTVVRSLHCKLSLFVIHAMTGFSTWCWLLVSILRYTAVYHPLWHLSHQHIGRKLLLAILLFSLLMKSWLLFAVGSHDQTCSEVPLLQYIKLNRLLHAFGIGWSYIVPACITLAVDIRVMLTRSPRFIADTELRTNSERRRPQLLLQSPSYRLAMRQLALDDSSPIALLPKHSQSTICIESHFDSTPSPPPPSPSLAPSESARSFNDIQQARSNVVSRTAMHRWLLITSIDLLLNTPDNVMRLIILVSPHLLSNITTSQLYHTIAIIARLLYFSQYCFNTAYLYAVVYRPSAINVVAARSSRHTVTNNSSTTTRESSSRRPRSR